MGQHAPQVSSIYIRALIRLDSNTRSTWLIRFFRVSSSRRTDSSTVSFPAPALAGICRSASIAAALAQPSERQAPSCNLGT